MSLAKITCPACGASAVKYIPLEVKFATCHNCQHKFDVYKEGLVSPSTSENFIQNQSDNNYKKQSDINKNMGCLVKIWIYFFMTVMAFIMIIYLLFHDFGDGAGR